ncbi:MAG: c-type cytochrome [Acidobacteriota bacterium]
MMRLRPHLGFAVPQLRVSPGRGAVLLLCALVLGACRPNDPDLNRMQPSRDFETTWLAGVEVSGDVLQQGFESYTLYCYACHGHMGDGAGPAAPGLRPPPRDFRQATYKFGWVTDGLPHDDDLRRIIEEGLHGTAMLKWDIPPGDLDAIVQYIKLFAIEDWADPDALGEQVALSADPWTDKHDEALVRGSDVYHAVATCQQCHPAYVTMEEVEQVARAEGRTPTTRPNPFYPELKESQYEVDGRQVKVMPPDFLYHPVRVSHELDEVYKTIGAGIAGTAMPAWKGSLAEDDLWALSYYVKYLIDMRDTAEAESLRRKLFASEAAASSF